VEGNGDRQSLAVAGLMRGALLLTAAKTPYRRAGLAFPVGMPLTVAILSLTVIQLRQLIADPQVTVMVGQDNGAFILIPELDREATDAQLQDFIDAAPPVEIEAFPAGPTGPEEELADLRQRLDDASAALNQANARIETLQDADKASAAALATAQADNEALGTRIAELEAKLAEAATSAATASDTAAKPAATKAKAKAD
jgi:hypothetical protein